MEEGARDAPGEFWPEVEVLLATYNGERFLREQLDSILAQEYPSIRVLARDDGSSDRTPAILAEYAERLPRRFTILPLGEPAGGTIENFRRLLEAATAMYVCFADQDDVWLPAKLRISMEAMRRLEDRQGHDRPLLVFTDLRVVDDALRTVRESMWDGAGLDPEAIHRLARLLGQNVVTGCTALINRPMVELARRMPPQATMHDRWIGLLASSRGAAAALREPTVLYRQHQQNVIGAALEKRSVRHVALRSRDDRGRRRERWRSEEQTEALLTLHGAEMALPARQTLAAYLRSGRSKSRLERIWLTLRYGFFRSGILRNAATLWDLCRRRSGDGLS